MDGARRERRDSFKPRWRCTGPTGAEQPESIEEVVITGSRIVRRDLDAPSPILTVDAENFEQNSSIGLEAVLNQYPQFSPGATQFTASDIQPTAQNSPGASTLNMRNLGASRGLVLLDGRRAQPVNAAMTVDINTLPAAAIADVEVISGGAAATYGPDAMAGVVNFKLRRDFEGVSVNYQTGFTDVGDGEETRIDALIGVSDASGRGNVMFSATTPTATSLIRASATFSRSASTIQARAPGDLHRLSRLRNEREQPAEA